VQGSINKIITVSVRFILTFTVTAERSKYMHTQKWLNKLERKFGRCAVPGMMNIIITGMVIVWIMDSFICPLTGKMPLTPLITFSRDAIVHGQIWRVLSFVFEPMTRSPFFMIFALYFYWMIGQVLESQWGTFRFNLYLCCAIAGAVIAGFITGSSENSYMILTMFLAFAVIAPDFRILLFFIIPVKIKYIAILDAVFLTLSFILSGFAGKIAILFSLINFFIFFGEDFTQMLKLKIRHWKYKMNNRR